MFPTSFLRNALAGLRLRRGVRSAPFSFDPATREALDRAGHDDDRLAIAHFSRLLDRHGHSHAALDWNSRDSQERRFGVLAGIGLASGDSVLDVGCGTGDLLGWLTRAGVAVDYTGVDITPMMVSAARERFPGRPFVEGCLLQEAPLPAGPFDWVVASGVFAHRRDCPEAHLRAMIEAMLARARLGVAVNSLSTKAPDPYRWRLFHADPDALHAWACDHPAVARAVLREDYDPNDFTLYLHRTSARGALCPREGDGR